MSDLVRALAFAFRRKGADALPGTDLRLMLAYDLRWFAPEDAKRVVQRARELGLLAEADGVVRPTFDPARVEVPVNFRPTVAVLDEEVPADLPPPAPRAAAPAPAPTPPPPESPPVPPAPGAALAEAERARRGGLMSLEVAALVVARRGGEDVTGRLAEAEARVLKG